MRHGDLYRQVVQSLNDGILVLRLDGVIGYANEAAAGLLGADPETLAGRPIDDFLDAQGRRQSSFFLGEAARGIFLDEESDSLFLTEDGEKVWVRLMQTGLYDGDRVVGAILRITDNHQTKVLLDQLSESQTNFEDAERIARIGSWTWDLQAGTVTHSRGLEELFGSSMGKLLSRDMQSVGEITHPEDQERLATAIAQLKSGDKPRIDVELRQLGEAGWMWVRLRALGTYDTDGELVCIAGTHQDVTRARDTADQLQDQVTQNSLMQAVASASNRATTLEEVLLQAKDLVVLHDDWERARAFVPTADGTDVEPIYLDDEDRAADASRPEVAAREAATARRALLSRESVWDDHLRLTIASPVKLQDEVLAIVTITSLPPLYRHDMIRAMVEQATIQLARVAERERAAADLAYARDRALEASRHKSEFLATMSHEIRTPLNGIIGLTELLGRTRLDAQQRHLTSGIAVSGRALLSVINDILDFSKIEAGHLEVERIDFEVRDVFEQVAGVLSESARVKGLDLQVSCHPDVPEVLAGDPTRLAQVLTNLGSNAVKFTSRGSVTIRATSRALPDGDTELHVEVRDTGVGVSADQRREIFAPFAQADTSTTRRFGGTGLGLAISAELVAAFGGEIGLDSRLGEGSSFWFTARLHPPTGSRHDARLRRVREQLGRSKVLVVDDNRQNRLILSEQLSWWRVTSTGVGSAAEARAALTSAADAGDPYDAVLLDLAMPDQDGLDLARSLQADPRFARMPLVLLSSMRSPSAEEIDRSGIVESLTKPVQSSLLLDVLLRVLAGVRPTEAAEQAPPERRGHVLVVEDNQVNQVVARGLLASLGYEVDTADDGHEALELTETVSYDAILMDLQMPRLDGYGATRSLRERETSGGARRTPVIAMTAAAITGEREKCLAAGMDDFLTKPVAPAALAAALARWVPGDGEPVDVPVLDPVEPAGPPSTHLDLERLEMLRELSPDDNAYLDRVITGFSTRTPGIVEELTAALGEGDAARVAAAAHSIKGSALNIGLPTVGGLGQELERLGRSGGLSGGEDLLLRLEAAVADAQEALGSYQEWYRSLPPGA